MALAAAGDAARGATVVCTLEPCSHHGRTPPCADALVAAGVARVVIGALDPLERDRAQGREVLRRRRHRGRRRRRRRGGRLRRSSTPAFVTWAVTGLPHVTLKLATSLDGKIATATGESRWISGAASRAWCTAGAPTATPWRWASAPPWPTTPCSPPATWRARCASRRASCSTPAARLPRDAALWCGDLATAPVIVVAAGRRRRPRVEALTAAGVESCSRCPATRPAGSPRGLRGAGRPRHAVGLRRGRRRAGGRAGRPPARSTGSPGSSRRC